MPSINAILPTVRWLPRPRNATTPALNQYAYILCLLALSWMPPCNIEHEASFEPTWKEWRSSSRLATFHARSGESLFANLYKAKHRQLIYGYLLLILCCPDLEADTILPPCLVLADLLIATRTRILAILKIMAMPPLIPLPTLADLTASQAPGIQAANLTVAILATISVALRFLARRLQRIALGLDDWLILAALVMSPFCSWIS